jgi:hypothetical protein
MAPTFVFTELYSIASHPFWKGQTSFGWRAIYRRGRRRKPRASYGKRINPLFFCSFQPNSRALATGDAWLTPAARHMLPGADAPLRRLALVAANRVARFARQR